MPVYHCGPNCTTEQKNSGKGCGDRQVKYVGATLYRGEHNGYHDSDFYALVWDEDTQAVIKVSIGSTSYWSYHDGATVDATDDVKVKAARYLLCEAVARHQELAVQEASVPAVGDRVRSLTTRGKAKGAVGEIVWSGDDQYRSSRHLVKQPQRFAILTDGGEKVYVNDDRVELVEPKPVDEGLVLHRAQCEVRNMRWLRTA